MLRTVDEKKASKRTREKNEHPSEHSVAWNESKQSSAREREKNSNEMNSNNVPKGE